MTILEANRQQDLYFLLDDGRVAFLPKDWADEILASPDDTDEPEVYCWYGNDKVLSYLERKNREWLTTDAQGWFRIADLEKCRRLGEAEAKKIDPALFQLLSAVNNGEAT